MFSTDFIFRQQEIFVDNQKCQAGFRPLCNKILLFILRLFEFQRSCQFITKSRQIWPKMNKEVCKRKTLAFQINVQVVYFFPLMNLKDQPYITGTRYFVYIFWFIEKISRLRGFDSLRLFNSLEYSELCLVRKWAYLQVIVKKLKILAIKNCLLMSKNNKLVSPTSNQSNLMPNNRASEWSFPKNCHLTSLIT